MVKFDLAIGGLDLYAGGFGSDGQNETIGVTRTIKLPTNALGWFCSSHNRTHRYQGEH